MPNANTNDETSLQTNKGSLYRGNLPKTVTLSVIVPTYNEKDNIVPLVENLKQVLHRNDYEIVIVDDNSQDGTIQLVRELSKNHPIELLVRKDKKGLASAVVDGFEIASGDFLTVMDADLQHPPQVIERLLRQLQNGVDVAIASRYVEGGKCEEWGIMRRIISKGAIFLAHLLLPQTRRIKDPMSGYFALNKKVLADTRLEPRGYKILMELLVEGHYNTVTEVPYTFENRRAGASKLRLKQQIDYLKDLFNLMKRSGELLRFIKFCIVGLSGVAVNMGLLWLLTEVVGLFYLVSATISIETSIISNYLLNDYFTFSDRRSGGTGSLIRRFLKFNLISLAGLGINLSTLWLLTSIAGVYYLLSNLVGIALATLWNYLVNSWWTWK